MATMLRKSSKKLLVRFHLIFGVCRCRRGTQSLSLYSFRFSIGEEVSSDKTSQPSPQISTCHTWMSQGVSKWLVNGL